MLAPSAAVFSVLLLITGIAKLVRPHDVERALTQLGMPRIPGVGYVLGSVEVMVGSAALLFPQVLVVQAFLYVGFAVWVAIALRADVPIASCGCLGRDDTPPTTAHVALNAAGAIVSILAVFGTPLDLSGGIAGVAVGVTITVGVFLGYVVLTDAAALSGVRSR